MIRFILRHKIEVLLLVFAAAYFLFFSRYGIDIDDEGFHLYVSNLILKGFTPYKDFILHVTPGSFYLQALVFKAFAPTVMAGRMTVVFLGLLITWLLYRISRNITRSDYFAAISGVLFIFWGVPQIRHPWYGWYGLAMGLAFLYFYLKYLGSGNYAHLFFTGLFCGAAFLIKQNLGMACLGSYLAFLFVSLVFSGKEKREKPAEILRKQSVFITGILAVMGSCTAYFAAKGALTEFLYYVFGFAALSAKGRMIFNPFPHVKSASVVILAVFFLLAWLFYNYYWGNARRKKVFLFLSLSIISAIIALMAIFVIQVNNVDNIYLLDRVKMGAVNGFFNLAMLAVVFSIFVIARKLFQERYIAKEDKGFIFITLFSIFYIWASLCISRDHLHLVLGMPPAYMLLSFVCYEAVQRLKQRLVRKNKDALSAARYASLTVCVFPLVFVSYFGFFTAFKNEGFRSIFPPIVNMRSELKLPRASGILVTEKDKETIEGIVRYIESNTSPGEKIFDTYKSSLFYFLSDRAHASFYYILHTDLFRPDKQDDVIKDIVRYNIKLAITGKGLWDSLDKYTDDKANPLTFKILRYMRDNFKISAMFGEYYILKKQTTLHL
ncbi:MAG: hypothetical protein Q8O12_02035 [Candidatus Omnitrophota bacterium]|nr:hypothetical protein [Candidatus Omnitrophota bacterium]